MNTLDICQLAPVIPVLVIEEVEHAAPLAHALVKGGLPALEVTLRTPCALEAIAEMAKVQGGVVGAGTLLNAKDVLAAKKAGARFGVSPGFTPALLDAAKDADLPLLPGVNSPSEVMALLENGIDIMKFFPAEAAGGRAMLKAIFGPLPQAKFCPTGGITPQNKDEYLSLENTLCVGGSWIAPKTMVQAGDWQGIEALARGAKG